jgi:glutamine---fructose-6-phosphate transaminase (isomerizing)
VKKNSQNLLKKTPSKPRAPKNNPQAAGADTLREILSQPDIWRETARTFSQNDDIDRAVPSFSPREPWLFIACGSSYYLSQTVATLWNKLFPAPCSAVTASEFLFSPGETLQRTAARYVVLISRSGKTTEVLGVAEWLKPAREIRTLGVTCNDASALASLCTHTLKLPWADEKSMVMTRSFTSILLTLQRIGARLAGHAELAHSLDSLPKKADLFLAANADKIRAFAAQPIFSDYVFLGQGVHYWLAQEAALKMTEMSSSYAQAYHTLEFRHGPKSIAGKDTLITFLLSDAAAKEEIPLIAELKQLRAAIAVITNRATTEIRNEADLLVELGLDEPEFARMALTAIPAQLLGLEVGLRKGLNPDVPKNLTRAVVLDPNSGTLSQRSRA